MKWPVECACVVCHGPLTVKTGGVTAIVCRDDGGLCNARWARMRRGARPAYDARTAQQLHAYRRRLELAVRLLEAKVAQVLDQRGLAA